MDTVIKHFCTSCGYAAPLDCRFCEECGFSFDEITHHQEQATSALRLNPFASLYDFVKQHLAVINGVVLFSGTVVGVLDFCVPVLKPVLIFLYWMTGGLSVLMLLAAMFPAVWINLISKLGYSNAGGQYIAVPLHKRDAWRGAMVLLMGVTAAGVVSLAKANQGGALASSFPSLKTLQESMLSMNQKTEQIQIGVKDANSKLDKIVNSIDPENSGDSCRDFACAIDEGASLETLNKLWKSGSRLHQDDSYIGVEIVNVVESQRKNRLEVLDFVYDHSIAPQDFKFTPYILSSKSLSAKFTPLVEQFWKAAKLELNYKFSQRKPNVLEKWRDLAYCIKNTDGGVTLIQFAAIVGDDELLKHLLSKNSKAQIDAISCRTEETGQVVVRQGQVKQLPPIVTYASILFSPLGEGRVATRQGDKP